MSSTLATRRSSPARGRARRWTTGALLAALLAGCAHAQRAEPRTLQDVPAAELFAQGIARANTGDHVAAEQYLQAALQRGYPEARAVRELVKVCLAAQRFDSALSYALPYLERHPDAWRLQLVVATVHLAAGDAATARRELSDLLHKRPDTPEAHFLMGLVLRDDYQDRESASRSFEHYLALAPRGAHAREARSWLSRMHETAVAPRATEVVR